MSIPARIIKSAVAIRYGISVDELHGRSQESRLITPRYMAMYLIRKLASKNDSEIGRLFSERHSGAVAYGIEKIENQLPHNDTLLDDHDTLIGMISADLRDAVESPLESMAENLVNRVMNRLRSDLNELESSLLDRVGDAVKATRAFQVNRYSPQERRALDQLLTNLEALSTAYQEQRKNSLPTMEKPREHCE